MIDKINGNDVYGYTDQKKRKNPAVKAYENTPGQKDAAGRKTGQKRGTGNMHAAEKGAQGVILDLSNQTEKGKTKAAQTEAAFSLTQAVRKLFEPIIRWLKNFWESDSSGQASGQKEKAQAGQVSVQTEMTQLGQMDAVQSDQAQGQINGIQPDQAQGQINGIQPDQAQMQMDGTQAGQPAEAVGDVKSMDTNMPAAEMHGQAAAEAVNQAGGLERSKAAEPGEGTALPAEQQSAMGEPSAELFSGTERTVSELLSGTERTVSELLSNTDRTVLNQTAGMAGTLSEHAAGTDRASAEQTAYEILESSQMEEDAEGLPPLEDISDLPKYGAISDEALKSGSLEQIEQLLTRNGTRHLAHNSDLLTYYDRWGRLIELDETQRHRVLFGDKNVMKL